MNYMKLDPANPVLKKELYNTIVEGLGGLFTCPDYENSRYGIDYQEKQNALYFSFKVPNFKDIYKISGDYFLKKHYSDYKLESTSNEGFDITVSKSLDFIQEIPNRRQTKQLQIQQQEIKNPTPQDEENKKKIKEENKKNIEKVVDSLSKFRVNFLSSPFEQAFDQTREGKQAKFTFTTRNGDRVWCLSDAESITVFYGMSFEDTVDRTIAKLMLDEFTESRRHVKNPPSINRVLEDQKFVCPQVLVDGFPELKNVKDNFLNGLISFTFFKKQHLSGDTDEVCNYLATFRQYIHYHISASKSYLHGRLLKNIATNLKNLKFTKFDQEEERNYRSQRDEILTNKVIEDQKKNIIKK